MNKKGPVVVIIRDGWGYRFWKRKNAIAQGSTPYTDSLMREYPNALIAAAGRAVGLPSGYQGNSEVGHMTMGAGRIIRQSLVRINESIRDGSFVQNEEFLKAIKHAKEKGTKLHLIGLLQTEGVHAHSDHLYALLDMCKKENLTNVCVHVITDGRDAPPKKGIQKIKKLEKKLEKIGLGKITTISGRYYAMDRDKRWERTKKAYEAIVSAEGGVFTAPSGYVSESYAQGVTDEFIEPGHDTTYNGMQEGDSVIFYNYRTDRPRQLTQAIVETDFDGWERESLDVYYVAMTQYYRPMHAHVAFPDESRENLLGEVVSREGMKQLRISETEKYAHVTFFFNGQREEPFDGEERVLIPSPKVATYDLQPEMSAHEIADTVVEKLDTDEYELVIINLVNGDMVGHTGVWDACIKAVETVDDCVKKIVTKTFDKKGTALVFADHGNIEDLTKNWGTSHTTNDVPFIFVSSEKDNVKVRSGGGLQDIAPTVLDVLGVEKPDDMTGESLIVR